MPKIPTNEEFDKRINCVHGNKFTRLEDRVPNQKHIRMFCNECKKEWTPCINHLFNGFGCPNCRKITPKEFDTKIFKIFGDKYKRIGKYPKNSSCKVKMKCYVCNHEQEQKVAHVLEGHGCWKCMRNKLINDQRLTHKEIEKRGKQINGSLYDYSLIYKIPKNEINIRIKIPINCKTHGVFYQILGDHLQNKAGCPKCKESHGEKEIRMILDENDITYERNKTFSNCKYKKLLPFDFYILKLNLCIEYDGEQHFTGWRFNRKSKQILDIKKTEESLKLFKIRDKIKTDYCKKNNIKLLRISYKDYKRISEIVTNYLCSDCT